MVELANLLTLFCSIPNDVNRFSEFKEIQIDAKLEMRQHRVIPIQKAIHFCWAILCWFDTFQPIRDKIFRIRKTTSKKASSWKLFSTSFSAFNICTLKSFSSQSLLLHIISFQWGNINIPWHVHQSRHILTHTAEVFEKLWNNWNSVRACALGFFLNLSYWCVFNCFVNCFFFFGKIFDLKNECDSQRSI